MTAHPAARSIRTTPEGLLWEPSERWVSGRKGDVTVVDSRHPVLVWDPAFPVRMYALPREEVRTDSSARRGIRPRAGTPVRRSSMTWRSTASCSRTRPGPSPPPACPDTSPFEWFRRTDTGFDHWYEEDEEIFIHPRDSHKRVDALPSRRHVVVEIDDTVVADTHRPVLLFEAALPTRYYIPPEDVRLDLFKPTGHSTGCPYKGMARYWSWRGAADVPLNILWSYPNPLPAAAPAKDSSPSTTRRSTSRWTANPCNVP